MIILQNTLAYMCVLNSCSVKALLYVNVCVAHQLYFVNIKKYVNVRTLYQPLLCESKKMR